MDGCGSCVDVYAELVVDGCTGVLKYSVMHLWSILPCSTETANSKISAAADSASELCF